MNVQSTNQARLDALWKAYIEADPDLRRLERRKKKIEHRRAWKVQARKIRAEAGQAILRDLIYGAHCVAIAFLTVTVLVLLLFGLA